METSKPNIRKLFYQYCIKNEWQNAKQLLANQKNQIHVLSVFYEKATQELFEDLFCHFPIFNKKQFLQKIFMKCRKNNDIATVQYIHYRFKYSFFICNKKQWKQNAKRKHPIISHFHLQNITILYKKKYNKKIFSALFILVLEKMQKEKHKKKYQKMQNLLFAKIIKNICHTFICTNGFSNVSWIIAHNNHLNIRWNNCFLNVCENGKLKNAKWILENHPQKISDNCFADSLRYSFENGYLDVGKWIISLVGPKFLFTKNHLIFKNCCKYEQWNIVDWLCCHFSDYYFALFFGEFLAEWFVKIRTEKTVIYFEKKYCQICDVNCGLIVAEIETDCHHTFCSECITKAFSLKSKCPCCRLNLKENMFAKIIFV
ncbi:MAG: hypothetical protein EB060_11920 [Proteobacteria bacterium]|nr:hypothetical protein [Pseudomonadota bacterium]